MKDTRTQSEEKKGNFEFFYKRSYIGKYKIIREISRGGMGIVYESYQEDLKRKIAIKVLPLIVSPSESSIKRFKREASFLANIRHKNIAQIYDFGSEKDCYYIVMEYVDGETLEEKLRKDKINLKEGIIIIKKVAEILNDLHSQNIVHRDVKPSNIMIKDNGDVVLLDFGIAKCIDDGKFSTLTIDSLGTPSYMPPEFALYKKQSKLDDKRSDIYSIGVVLYEIATKKKAFEGETYYEIVNKIIKGNFTLPRKINKNIPKEVETMILKCMALDIKKRYQNLNELINDIDKFLINRPISSKRSFIIFNIYLRKYWYFLLMLIVFGFFALLIAFESEKEQHKWKRAVKNSSSLNWKVYYGLGNFLRVFAVEQYLYFNKDDNSFSWLRNEPGFFILNGEYPGSVKIGFKIKFPEKSKDFSGVFINSKEGVSGYILKISPKKIELAKKYLGRVIKSVKINLRKGFNDFIFERINNNIVVYANGEKVISFTDYDPLIFYENNKVGVFFTESFVKIKDINVFVLKNPLKISPLAVGQRFFERGQYEIAIKEFEKIVNDYPNESISRIALLKIGLCYKELKKYDKALNYFNKIYDDKNKILDDKNLKMQALYQIAVCHFLKGDVESGSKLLKKVINEYEDYVDLKLNAFLFLKSVVEDALKRKVEKDDIYNIEKEIKFIMENYPEKKYLLSVDLRIFINKIIKFGFYEKALNYLELIKKEFKLQTPVLIWSMIEKGNIFIMMGKYKEAEDIFYSIINEYSQYGVYKLMALQKLGEIYLKTKRFNKAENIFRKIYIEYNNEKSVASNALIKIKMIENMKKNTNARK